MERLRGLVRPYAWGSRTALAALQGRPTPSDGPEAELWLGAHPAGSATLLQADGTTVPLAEAVAASPGAVLGGRTASAFGSRLPFLLKLLAAEQPLSLQAHPDAAQAAAGYAAEEAAGVPRDAAERNYCDPYHKPELLVALEPFEALCGFHDPGGSARLLAGLDVPELAPTVRALGGPGAGVRGAADAGAALRAAVTGLLTAEEPKPLVTAVVEACTRRAGDDPRYAVAADLGGRHPADIGVVVALLLNRVTLEPGEAVWMPAGNLHAYLRGFGVEVMAESDNVLRGGLTGKHVDVPELLRVLRFEVLDDPVRRPEPVGPGVVTWPVPVPDFALYRAVVSGGEDDDEAVLPGDGPRVLVCTRDEVRVDDGVVPLTLRAGEAAFVPAGPEGVAVSGVGEVFQATCG